MSSLEFKNVRVKLEGVAGARIHYESRTLCIDILNPLNCDYLLYTHHHPRHYPGDGVVSRLEGDLVVLTPMKGYKVKPGDTVKLGDIQVNVVDAYEERFHPKGLGVGFMIEFGGRMTLYHMGDTGLIDEILDLKGRVDVLLIPVGGDGVMNVEEAVEAVKSLRPIITIPIHYIDRRFFHRFRDMAQPYTQILDLKK